MRCKLAKQNLPLSISVLAPASLAAATAGLIYFRYRRDLKTANARFLGK
jgi:hypothetical protein